MKKTLVILMVAALVFALAVPGLAYAGSQQQGPADDADSRVRAEKATGADSEPANEDADATRERTQTRLRTEDGDCEDDQLRARIRDMLMLKAPDNDQTRAWERNADAAQDVVDVPDGSEDESQTAGDDGTGDEGIVEDVASGVKWIVEQVLAFLGLA
ncbi:MAG: hypothetical protein QMC79_04195 [Anaerosomatales bacterium]|nr:hypothetical protein [Anaerosomatales bacterium]